MHVPCRYLEFKLRLKSCRVVGVMAQDGTSCASASCRGSAQGTAAPRASSVTDMNSADENKGDALPAFFVGDVVQVRRDVFELIDNGTRMRRAEPLRGKRPRRDGVGRITRVDEAGGTVNISYVVGGGEGSEIDLRFISPMDFCPGASNLALPDLGQLANGGRGPRKVEAISTASPKSTTSPPDPAISASPSAPASSAASASNFVRRSTRRAGISQLRRKDVKALLTKLVANDKSIEVLRLKNFLLADTNSIVLKEVLNALRGNTVVQVLYIQNFEEAMDDSMLEALCDVLKINKKLWALNVGENFKITQGGWTRFAEALRETHVTHLYAGSEDTVKGKLKKKMRDVIRENRKKHKLHNDPDNIDVIMQIGQMCGIRRTASAFATRAQASHSCASSAAK